MKRTLTLLLALLLLLSSLPVSAEGFEGMIEKAEAYAAEGDYPKSLASYELAQKLNPENEAVCLGKANIYLLTEDFDKAASAIDEALAINPISPEAWTLKCLTDVLSGNMTAFEEDSVFASVCGVEISSPAALCAEEGFFEKAASLFAQEDIASLDNAQRRLYKKALIETNQEALAETLGLTSAAARNPALDAAFEKGALSLVLTEMPVPAAEDFEFPDALWEAVIANYGQPPEDITAELEEELKESTFTLYSLSPSGNSGLIQIDGSIWLGLYEGKYRLIYPLSSRGVPDETGDLTKLISTPLKNLLNNGVVVYSPDGRYAAIYNYQLTLRMLNTMMDPVIIDLATGEAFLAAAHGNKMTEDNFGIMTSACFSADGQYFYYMLMGNTAARNTSLYRYDLTADKAELCFSGYDDTYYPLAETADGELFAFRELGGYDETHCIVVMSEENGQWTAREYSSEVTAALWRPHDLVYSTNSGCALVTGQSILNRNTLTLQPLRPDEEFSGIGQYIAITKEDNSPILLTDEDLTAYADSMDPEDAYSLNSPYHGILNAALSPDGNYALIIINDMEAHAARLFLLRLEDLAMKEVDVPEEAALPLHLAYLEWNTDTLLIGTMNGPLAFRFE